jgi:hypothetical protein
MTVARLRCASPKFVRHFHVDLSVAADFTAFVRTLLSTILLTTVALTGCAGHQGGSPSFSEISASGHASVSLPNNNVAITPETQLVGKVAKVNVDGRFVVLTFPIGHLPALQQQLNIYRRGLKVGEVRVTGPQLDDNVVGDISAGDAQAGDEVRSQ